MDVTLTADQNVREMQRQYLEFLDDAAGQGIYTQKVRDMINMSQIRLVVNINHLRTTNPERAQKLITDCFTELLALQRALKEFVTGIDPTYSKQCEEFLIGLEGSFGANHTTPRTLTSRYLGQMVCVEGIVTKMSVVRPKIVRSVHYCSATKKTLERKYADLTSLDPFPSSMVYPTKDEDGNLLETEYGLSVYKDHQTFSVQEMPEKAPTGQLPRSVDIIIDNDLVDSCKPGDRVQIIGTFRCLPSKRNGFTSGTFRTVIIGNNVNLISKDKDPIFSSDDIAKVKGFSCQDQDVFELLARSLAPSIHGHEFVKKAILCMLLGGTEKILANGTRIRGDINVLLIGDPSVAKSQLLRYVLHTAPRAVSTTGRGSSGVGLTAAVTTDLDTGERHLEAGAMVLADRGVVCIDEFDKMSDMDRTAIHEVMEQGRVTIAKAGIHAKLNARCSVLAAANPVYGRYDQYKSPMDNIGLQDSLLSRFDLLFIVLDKFDPENDRKIAEHVLRMHRYRNPQEHDGDVLELNAAVDLLSTRDPDLADEDGGEDATPIYEKFDALLHGSTRTAKDKIISLKFMRKYIHLARNIRPVLTAEAANYMAEQYTKLRTIDLEGSSRARTQPVTARTLETMVRLSTAHAKCRLSKSVDLEDAEAAIELVEFACFQEVLVKRRGKKHDIALYDDEDESSDEDDPTWGPRVTPAKRKKRISGPQQDAESRPRLQPGDEGYDPYDAENIIDEDIDIPARTRSASQRLDISSEEPRIVTGEDARATITLSGERFTRFRSLLDRMFGSNQTIPTTSVVTQMQTEFSEGGTDSITEDEVMAGIALLQDQNMVMEAAGTVFRI